MASRGTPPAYVGLMSGTSLDGISAAAVRFHERRTSGGAMRYEVELLSHVQVAYTDAQREELRGLLREGSARAYCRAAFDLGGWLARAARRSIEEAGLPPKEIRAIGSHGHTLWHEPPHSTWQIGETAVIAEATGVDTIGDFRVADVAAGGQGAPLVPVADALLFASDDGWRALQNIGGIGNVTLVPPGGDLAGLRAFDTGPGVAVIDGVVEDLFHGIRFDVDGRLAARGSAIDEVVVELLEQPYFSAPPPKSTGRELFDRAYVRDVIDRCRKARPDATAEDIVATAVELTVRSIEDAYRRFAHAPLADVVPSGGGARHPVLVERLRAVLAPVPVRHFDEVFFDAEAKEAVAFALLAKLFVDGAPANVPAATGARGPRVLGKLQRASP